MELSADDIKTIREMRRWMQTNGQAGTLRPQVQRKPPRMLPTAKAMKLVKAPVNGIPGRVGTLLGQAECDVWNENTTTDQIKDSTENITVYNWATSAVCATGDRFGIAGWCNGGWYIIAEDCNDEGSTVQPAATSSTPTAPTNPLSTSPTVLTSSPISIVSFGNFHEVRFTSTATGGGFE